MAGDEGHRIMTEAALNSLPEWERGKIEPFKKELLGFYCMDSFHRSPEGSKCLVLPDGSQAIKTWELRTLYVPEPGVGRDYFVCGYYEDILKIFQFYIESIAGSLRKNKIQKTAFFVGIFAHIVEDASCPPHAIGVNWGVDLELIKLLYSPSLKEKRLCQWHSIFENNYENFGLQGKNPLLKGETPDEAAFQILRDFTDMLENSVAQIMPMAEAFCANDFDKLRKHLTLSGIPASRLIANALHTAFCIAYDRCGEFFNHDLLEVPLSSIQPVEWTAYAQKPYFCPVIRNSNMSLNNDFLPVPLELKVDGKPVKVKKGLGVGTPFSITYKLPSGVYNTFNARVGLHQTLGNGGKCIFKVLADGNTVFEQQISHSQDSKEFSVNLKDVSELSLITIPAKIENEESNHAIWGNPVLIRHKLRFRQ